MKKERWIVIIAGIAVGLAALVLQKLGNPANMGFCIACFERDIAGALGLHSAAKVQYVRPEIIGIVLGAFLMALVRREFRPMAGSSPAVRFVLGGVVMVGALVFLGCPLRMVLRLGGGDLNALVALGGFTLGVVLGTFAGSALAWLLLSTFADITLVESLAVGGGFGYYSLATVILTRLGDPALGSVALLSNMIHEALALVLPPFLLRFTGRLGPVLAGGAAAMDTCLPVVAQVSGERCAILAVFSGMCLTMLVPMLLPLIMALR